MADSLAGALAELQANPPRIRKRARAQYGAYADLPSVTAALRPALAKLGLLWQTWPTLLDETFTLSWKLTHLESGEFVSGWYPIHATDPQKAGSEITYARRYALVTVTGVTPEGDDDDGQAASGPQRTRARTTGAAPHLSHDAGGWQARQPDGSWEPISEEEAARRRKVTGTEHERLRHGTVEPTPDDRPAERGPVDNSEDLWTDQPAGEFEPYTPEDNPGSMDDGQRRKIFAMLRGKGYTDHTVIHGMIADWLGRESLLSVNQLSRLEADHVIKRIKEMPHA